MALYPVAGMKMYIGGVLSDKSTDFVESDFASQTWVEIDGWQTMGTLDDSAAEISTSLINRGRDQKQKGTAQAPSMQNTFAVIASDAGQIAFLAAAQPSNKNNYAFKIRGSDAVSSGTALTGVSMTAASPGVATKTAHGLSVGQAVVFTAGAGTLPTGIVDGTTYFVKTVPTADTFTVAATKSGTVINTTGSPSGTYTVTTVPQNSERLFIGLVMGAGESGGEANTIQSFNGTISINSNIVKVLATA